MSTLTFSQRHALYRNSFSSSQIEETVLLLLLLTRARGLLPSIPSSISYGYRKINGIKSYKGYFYTEKGKNHTYIEELYPFFKTFGTLLYTYINISDYPLISPRVEEENIFNTIEGNGNSLTTTAYVLFCLLSLDSE